MVDPMTLSIIATSFSCFALGFTIREREIKNLRDQVDKLERALEESARAALKQEVAE